MTARTGMTDLIQQLRAAADVGTADYTAGTVTYWSDDHLQAALDRHRIYLYQQPLTPAPLINSSNEYEFFDYHAPYGNLEGGTAGTAGSAVFIVQQYNGGSAPAYTVDYNAGIVTFTADTEGTAYMLTARSYDINAAAAEVWRNKAANAAKYFDFKTDNHDVKKSQFRISCLDMANYFDGQSVTQSFSVTTINRSDVHPAGRYDDDEPLDRR